MSKWDKEASLELVSDLSDTGYITEKEHQNASALIERGNYCEAMQYALKQAGLK